MIYSSLEKFSKWAFVSLKDGARAVRTKRNNLHKEQDDKNNVSRADVAEKDQGEYTE